MNKFFSCGMSVTLVCLTALSTACGKQSQADPVKLPEDFHGTAVITYEDKDFEAELSRAAPDIWQWSFTSPETIEGLTVTTTEEVCTICFQGLSYSIDRENFSMYSFISLVDSSADALIAGRGLTCTGNDKNITESGQVSGLDFSAQICGDKLESISIGDNLTVKFTG